MTTSPVPPAHCLCRSVKLTFHEDARPMAAHCYCKDCSHNGGGFSQLSLVLDEAAVTVEDPENLVVTYGVQGTESGLVKRKSFCGRCGCTLFTKTDLYKEKVFVVASLTEGGCALYKPNLEVYTKNRPAYLTAVEGAIQFDGAFEGVL